MQQLIINITNDSKAQTFIDFLKQLDFIKIEEVTVDKQILKFQKEILESHKDLKKQNVTSWKNKTLNLHD